MVTREDIALAVCCGEHGRCLLKDCDPEGDTTACIALKGYHDKTIDAVIALFPAQEWQDISTAPKDGTKIILYHEKWETFPIAMWEWGEGPEEDGTGGWCAWHTIDDRFPGAEDGIIYPSENHMPTHWMPLPPVAVIADERTTE